MTRYDVCAVVVSDLQYDARVWKQARSLANAGYRVKLIGCRYGRTRTVSHTSADGIDVVEVPLGRTLAGRARAMLLLWKETLATNARVYHTHNIHPAPATWIACRLHRARLVYDGHELYGEGAQSGLPGGAVADKLSFWIERRLIRGSDVAITTNPSRADVLEAWHGRRVEVLANVPAPVDHLEPLDPGYPEGHVLLYQGGIYPERAFHEVIQAVARLNDVQFAITGFGSDRAIAQIAGWAEKYGVGDRVHLYPPRPFEELVRTAAPATVGIVPLKGERLNHRLGDTNKLHEYLMAGLPVVASDLPEIQRVLAEGDPPVGEVFDPDSPESIAAAVERVIRDPAYGRRRAEARRLALERFNWRIEEQKLLDWYGSLIGSDGGDGS